jgi:hypothetical protein
MKIRFLTLLSFLPVLSFASLLARSSDLQAPVAIKIPMEQFLESKGYKAHFSNPVFYVELKNGTKAVLKFVAEDWKKPACAEVAAFRASKFLKINLVPPTIFYTQDNQTGTLQQYVEPFCDLMDKKNHQSAVHLLSPDIKASMQLFYFIFGQWDPDPSNMIISKQNKKLSLHLIDNGAMATPQKVRYGEHPFVLCFPATSFPDHDREPYFPFSRARTLPADARIWKQEFGHILSEKEILQLCKLKKPITFIIWKGKFYRKYGFGLPSSTSRYPKKLMKRLERLSLHDVQQFFANSIGCTFSEEFFQDILERRDQVLQAYTAYNLVQNSL